VANYPEEADRAWVAMTSNPRRTDDRQHQLKGQLAQTTVGGQHLTTGRSRPLPAAGSGMPSTHRADPWVTQARAAHPKQTDPWRALQALGGDEAH
jgi:hypothetical protein